MRILRIQFYAQIIYKKYIFRIKYLFLAVCKMTNSAFQGGDSAIR